MHVVGRPQPGDQFVQDEKVEGIVAGSGPVSVTARVFGINPGEWTVTANMLNPAPGQPGRRGRANTAPTVEPVYQATWSWRRWKLLKGSAARVKTTWLPFIRVPGVIPGFWAAMAVLGFVVALAVQAQVISRTRLELDNAPLSPCSRSRSGSSGRRPGTSCFAGASAAWMVGASRVSWQVL